MNDRFFAALSGLPYEFAIPFRTLEDLLNKAIGTTEYKGSVEEINPKDGTYTELWEAYEAIEIYKRNPNIDTEIEVLLEIGDIYSQRAIAYHRHSVDYGRDLSCHKVIDEITKAIDHLKDEYMQEQFPFNEKEVMALNVIKVVTREILKRKDKELEHELAKSVLLKMRVGNETN